MQEIDILNKLQIEEDLTTEEQDIFRSWMDEDRMEFFDPDEFDFGELPFLAHQHVIEEWGGEGQGDSAGFIMKFGDRFVKVDAYYNSWEGTNYDEAEITEVKPVEKVIVVYESVES